MRPKNDGSYNNSSQTLISSLPQANANFGKSITGEGAELAIGAPGQTVNGFVGAGAVVTFREPSQGFDYNLRELIATLNSALDNKFGSSVAMNNGTLVVGAPGVDQPAAPDAGAAVIYDESPTGSMDPVATLTDPTPTSGAALGTSVSVSDQTVAAGAPMADVGSNAGQGDVAVYVPPTFDSSIPIGAIIPTGTLFDPNGSSGNQYGASFVLSPDLAAAGAPEGTTAANRTRGKALADAGPGEVLAYVPNRLFKDSLESIRGALDGCASPNTPILDNDPTGITSDITLTGSGTARQIDVELRIAHTQISDLNVSLTHVPSGITVPLYIPAQSCPHHDIDATFSDRAADGFASSTCNPVDPALDGFRIPKDWLIQFQGQTRAGPWHLTVKDTVATNTGALQFWCVNVR
jgi:subtilisin-like proprotein convertase family protein